MITPGKWVDQWKIRDRVQFLSDNNNKDLERSADNNGDEHELCQTHNITPDWAQLNLQ